MLSRFDFQLPLVPNTSSVSQEQEETEVEEVTESEVTEEETSPERQSNVAANQSISSVSGQSSSTYPLSTDQSLDDDDPSLDDTDKPDNEVNQEKSD